MTPQKRATLSFFSVVIGLFVAGLTFQQPLLQWYGTVRGDLDRELTKIEEKAVESIAETVERVRDRVVMAPPPITRDGEATNTTLTVAGTIARTNSERSTRGLVELRPNSELTAAAKAKAQDLFARQYFEHVSPTGEGPSDLAEMAGYDYIVIGENLALGNFADDADLVQAWMDSPGHRANILNDEFTEIGVAVEQGMYKGGSTWIAVQEFGRPRADCPAVNEAVRLRIADNGDSLAELRSELDTAQSELSEARRSGDREAYNEKVDAYNNLVRAYNDLVEETKRLVADFNRAVQQYNACVGD